MADQADVQRAEQLVRRLRDELEQQTLVYTAAGVLAERHRLTAAATLALIEKEAHVAGRAVEDVAQEIVDGTSSWSRNGNNQAPDIGGLGALS